MDKLNIIFVAPTPPPYGGIANWMAMLSRYLDTEMNDKILYKIIDTSPKKRVTEGRGIIQRVTGGLLSLIKTSRKIKEELKKELPDCVHITTSGSLGLMRDRAVLDILAKKRINTVYHIRFGRVSKLLKCNNWESKLLKYNLQRAEHIIAIDETTYRSLIEYGLGEKSVYIPNCINLKELPKRNEEAENIITFIGWVIPTKGISELAEAWKGMPEAIVKDWRLEIIGPYSKEYVASLKLGVNKTTIFVGELEHKAALERLNYSKAFVLPRYTEGFPNSVLEAMALGKIIVATDVGAIPEMLSEDCGIVIKAKNVEELKNALFKVVTENVGKLGINAFRKVKEKYEISKVVEQYIKLWRKSDVI